jgi:hypothetical protein
VGKELQAELTLTLTLNPKYCKGGQGAAGRTEERRNTIQRARGIILEAKNCQACGLGPADRGVQVGLGFRV